MNNMNSVLNSSGGSSGGGGGAGSNHSSPTQPSPNQSHSQQQQQQQQQYCLKWNNHTNNMVKVFNELLGDENFVDVTLACDGVSIKAHKLVLSACSTYFRDLFINNPCKHPIVILKDIQYDDLRAIIHFMYSGEVNVSYTQLGPLLKTAEALKVKGLTDVSEKHGYAFSNGSHTKNGNSHHHRNNSNSHHYQQQHQHDRNAHHSDGGGSVDSAAGISAAAANIQLYNRMALESITNSSLGEQNPYLAFMAQRLKKRKRKHPNGVAGLNGGKNGGGSSALALATILQNGNGGLAAMLGVNGAFGGGKVTSSSPNKKPPPPPHSPASSTTNNNNSNGVNGNGNHDDYECEDNGESGDEVNSNKRLKDSNSSSDSLNNESVRSSSSHRRNNNHSNNSNSNNNKNGSNKSLNHDNDDEEEEDGGDGHDQDNNNTHKMSTRCDDEEQDEADEGEEEEEVDDDDDGSNMATERDTNGDHDNGDDTQLPHESLMMSMNDSDDEFYTDVKPIVSLDESPSPTNSNLDDSSSYSNSFSAMGTILENSLTGSNLPNSSTKVCVCHLCHLTFTAYSSLRRHMTRHYADRERYECDICLKSYSRKDYLKEHKKLKHSDVAKLMAAQRHQLKQEHTSSVM